MSGVREPGSALEDRRARADTSPVKRTILALLLLLPTALSAHAAASPAASPQAALRGADYRPDAWIKLCGLSTGCTIDPLPHPWLGRNVINTTGRHQTVHVRMEDGEGVRFWITLENDGALEDTLTVQGCQGNRRFLVNKVLLGKHKRPEAGTTEITGAFKHGTASWDFPPSSDGHHAVFTLNIIAPTTAEGVSYRCEMTVSSAGDPTATDTVVATMTTY